MSQLNRASTGVLDSAPENADKAVAQRTPRGMPRETELDHATTRQSVDQSVSLRDFSRKRKMLHRVAEAGIEREADQSGQAADKGRHRHESISITDPLNAGGYGEAYLRIQAAEQRDQARRQQLDADTADAAGGKGGPESDEADEDDDDLGDDAERLQKEREKRKKPKVSMRERIRLGCKVSKDWATWFVKRAWEEATCHYRKKKIMLKENEWVTHEVRERADRIHTIKRKYKEIYHSKVEEFITMAKRKEITKFKFARSLLSLRFEYLRHDFVLCVSNLLGFVHTGTGLPLSVLAWYHFESKVHEGPHGLLYKATDSKGRTVAVKIRDKSRGMVMWLPLKRAVRTLHRKVTPSRFPMMRRLLTHCGLVTSTFHHDHVVKVFAVYDNAEFFVEVSEFMPGGSLLDFCEGVDGAMDEHSVCIVFTRILLALQYMHHRRLMHRDLRLSQILLARAEKLEGVKISDFWFMTKVPTKSFLNENSLPGDIATRAPEVILRGEWSIKADIWSAGCVLFELLFGHPPFGGHGEALVDRICRQGPEFDILCGKISDAAMDLLRLCLKRNVAQRPSAHQLLQHKWFREYGSDRKKQSVSDRLENTAKRIKRVAIYGKEPNYRRGLPPKNLLNAKTGMFNSGFCTPMGLTKCTIDLIIGDPDEYSLEKTQYWVKTIMVSLWGQPDNPRKIVAFGAQRANIPWVQLMEHHVQSEQTTEARLVIDKPLRFVRLVMTGNFGGVYGIALQKLTMYGFEITQEPIVFALDKSHYARGSAPHTHRDDFKDTDVPSLDKLVRDSLERGARIPGTGQRYYVYRDLFSGAPHTTTVAQMYIKMAKGNTICAASLSLRFVAYAPTLSSTPRLRIGVDAEEGKVLLCTTHALPVARWQAEEVCTMGYSDMETIWVTDLSISTDNGFAIELHFENNAGYVHIPADCGLTLYYISDVPEVSDDSDMDEHQTMAKMARKNRREGVDMGVLDSLANTQMADLAKEHHHHHHHHHHTEEDKGDDPLANSTEEPQDIEKVSIMSDSHEIQMQNDLKELRDNAQYGRWGASDYRRGDVRAWHPRLSEHDNHEKGANPSRASEVHDRSSGIGSTDFQIPGAGSDGLGVMVKDRQAKRTRKRQEKWWDEVEDEDLEGRSSESEGSSKSEHIEVQQQEEVRDVELSSASKSSEDSLLMKAWGTNGGKGSQGESRDEDEQPTKGDTDLSKTAAEESEIKAQIIKNAEEAQKEIAIQKEMRAEHRAQERKVRLYKQMEAQANAEMEESRLREWEEIAEHWQDKGHRLKVLDAKPAEVSNAPQTPGSGRMSMASGRMTSPGSGGRRQSTRSSIRRTGGLTAIFGGDHDVTIEERIAEFERRRKRARGEKDPRASVRDADLHWLCPAADQPFCSSAYSNLQSTLPAMLLPFTPPVPPSTPRAVGASTMETSGEQSKPQVPELNLASEAPWGSRAVGGGKGAVNGCTAM